MLAGREWDEDVESEMGGLAAESAHLRPPLGGVAGFRHGLWRQGGRRIHLVRPELMPVIGRSAAGPRQAGWAVAALLPVLAVAPGRPRWPGP